MKDNLFSATNFYFSEVALIFAILFCCAFGEAQAERLIGVDESSPAEMCEFNPQTGSLISSSTLVSEVYSVARDPGSGHYYVITRSAPGSASPADQIARINIATGAIFNRVNLSIREIDGIAIVPIDNSAKITILKQRIRKKKRAARNANRSKARRLRRDARMLTKQLRKLRSADSTIFGILGGERLLERGTIYRINKTTGRCTETGWNNSKWSAEQSLEYNWDNGLLYHFHKGPISDPSAHFSTIDPVNGGVTFRGALNPGSSGGEISGAAYRGAGQFFIAGRSPRDLFRVNTSGDTTLIGNSGDLRGPTGLPIRALVVVPGP